MCLVIATSGPSIDFPKRAYRNPLDALVNFLDNKHGKDWCIWEFRAEGTGYPDSEVYHRIHHYPWPDHHPPPFALIPAIMGSMRNWLQSLDDDGKKDQDGSEGQGKSDKTKRVAVVHCKAGKGRSGTIACGYLISEQGWKAEDALQRFTERRMRVGFGAGVSIPSQLRYVDYIDRWVNSMSKKYIERPVEIMEIHVWGLKDGVKVAVEGFAEEGKQIKCFHLFHRNERTVVDDGKTSYPAKTSNNGNNNNSNNKKKDDSQEPSTSSGSLSSLSTPKATPTSDSSSSSSIKRRNAVIYRPKKPIILPSSDVNIDFERRSKTAAYTGWAMVTSIAHVWFNAYFEGGNQHDSNVFEADWDALDGIKGTTKKGVRALDRVKVVWRYPTPSELRIPQEEKKEEAEIISPSAALGHPVMVPKPGEPVPESSPADWRGQNPDSSELPRQEDKGKENLAPRENIAETTNRSGPESEGLSNENHPWLSATTSFQTLEKELGLRKQADESQDESLANSEDEKSTASKSKKENEKDLQQLQQLQQHDEGHAGAVKRENPDIQSPLEAVQPYFGIDGGSSDERDKK